MGRMTLESLRKLRESKRVEMDRRDGDNKSIQVIVGMGTSGIAAGAKDTLRALMDALELHELSHVSVRQTGSLGLDHAEPTVEIRMPGMPTVIYGKVTPEVARLLIHRHILEKSLVSEHIYDRPAADLNAGSEEK